MFTLIKNVSMRMCVALALLLSLGSELSAQINYSFNFDANATGWTGNFTRFTGTSVCGGTGASMRRNLYSGATTGQLVSPLTGTATGGLISMSYSYKVADWSANTAGTANPWGSFNVEYGPSATGPWTIAATVDQTNHTVSGSCAAATASFTAPAGPVFVRFNATWVAGDYYLNFDNISLSEALPACSGSPAATTAVGPTSVCPGSNFTLSLTPAISVSGIAYQWESADDAGFTTNLTALGTAATQTTSQTSAKYYRCNVTCTNSSLSTMSSSVFVPMSSVLACYCTATQSNCSGDGITNVAVGTLNNPSTGCPGSGNYTYFTPGVSSGTFYQGATYTLAVSVQSDGNQWVNAWIDYNADGVLSAGEALSANSINAGANGTTAISFTIPTGATAGLTRLRVRGGNDVSFTTAQACGADLNGNVWGEVEDYDITIATPPPCSGAPIATTVTSSNAVVCPGSSTTLAVSSPGIETGYTYQWESSSDDIIYTPISGANSATLTESPTSNTYYRCLVTCLNSAMSTLSNSVLVSFDGSADAGSIAGPSTGVTYQSLSYTAGTTLGDLQWQFATAAAGPYSDLTGEINASLTTVATSGGTFYIRLRASSPTCTTYSNIVTTTVTVAGDNVCDALPLGLGLNGPFTNQGATIETGEAQAPNTSCSGQSSWCTGTSGIISNTVWFTLVAPASGRVSIELDPTNLWDSQIAVWSATSCSDLTSNLGTLVAANDDIAGSPFHSKIDQLCVVPGQTYYVQVDGYGTTTKNNFQLLVTEEVNAAPAFSSCPSTVYVTTACDATTATATWETPTVSDECGATLTSSHNSGDAFPIGTTTVTLTANDGINPAVTCSFDVVVTGITSSSNTTTAASCVSYVWAIDGMTYTASGTYTVTSTNASGCTHTETLDLTINPLPTVTAPNLSMCPGSTLTLGGSPAGGFWDLPNPYTGNATAYTYTYTDANGCSNSATASINPTVAIVTNVNVINVTGISGTATYSAINGIGWYEIRYKPVSGTTWTTGTTNAATKPLINLTPNTAYELQVRGFCSTTNPGPWSASTLFSTNNICGTPVNLNTTNIAGSSAKLNWDAVSGAGFYTVRWKAVSAATWSSSTSSSNSKSIAGLTPNTNYEFQVRTNCGSSASPYSPSSFFTTAGSKGVNTVAEVVSTDFNVYPNPTTDEVNIDFGVEEFTVVTVKVSDMSGRVVKQVQANAEIGNNNVTVSLGDLTNGVYTIQLIGNDKLMHVTRMVKN